MTGVFNLQTGIFESSTDLFQNLIIILVAEKIWCLFSFLNKRLDEGVPALRNLFSPENLSGKIKPSYLCNI